MNATTITSSIRNQARSQGSGTLRKNLSIERSIPDLSLQCALSKSLLRRGTSR